MTETNNMTLFVDYKDIPNVLFCHWIDRGGEYAFKIPRDQCKKEILEKFPESGEGTFRDKGCIYILYGEDTEEENAYIGQSVSIDTRLGVHAFSSKSWGWQEALIFCRDDTDFDISHLKYIEEQLILKARDCRIPLRNDGARPRKGVTCDINPAYEKTANDFVEGVQLICRTLGYKLFEPLPTVAEVSQPSTDTAQPLPDFPTFPTKASDKYKATGRFTGDGKTFMVFAGSTISPRETETIPESGKRNRAELQESGIIKNLRFEQDYVFSSPSAAAYVVGGASANGYSFWEGLADYVPKQE